MYIHFFGAILPCDINIWLTFFAYVYYKFFWEFIAVNKKHSNKTILFQSIKIHEQYITTFFSRLLRLTLEGVLIVAVNNMGSSLDISA